MVNKIDIHKTNFKKKVYSFIYRATDNTKLATPTFLLPTHAHLQARNSVPSLKDKYLKSVKISGTRLPGSTGGGARPIHTSSRKVFVALVFDVHLGRDSNCQEVLKCARWAHNGACPAPDKWEVLWF